MRYCLVDTYTNLRFLKVFIGETLSARVSYYELSVDGSERSKVKSSGLCVSTGTGSTSWTFNINKLTHQSVSDLMKLIQEETRLPLDYKDHRLIDRITAKFNDNLIFGPGKGDNHKYIPINIFFIVHLQMFP